MKVICSKEQDNLIKIKVKLLEKVKALKGKERRKQSQKIFKYFDSLPDFKTVDLIDIKCKKCTFPDCDHSKSMIDLLEEISEANAEDTTIKLQRSKYINKLFKEKCST